MINGKLNVDKAAKFVKLFKELPLSKAILALDAYAKGLKRVSEAQTLFVYSPVILTASELNKFQTSFKKTHSVADTKLILDPSLMGGLMFKIGDTEYDDTVRSRIAQVRSVIKG